MNVYVVTEGKAEGIVYKQWIPLINPTLRLVDSLDAVSESTFYIISAKGYPNYFDTIDNAIEDCNAISQFDRLVIAVDSEEMTKQDKYNEIQAHVSQKACRVNVRIVIQHFCFETWALANRKIIPLNSSGKLRGYKVLFDVRTRDPELLPAKPDENWNRSQFAFRYLALALNSKFRTLTYTKSNPKAVIHNKYLREIQTRLDQTGHVGSFRDLLNAFA